MKISFYFFVGFFLGLVTAFTPKFKPINPKQEKYQDFLKDPSKSIVFGIGSAGTGKTLFSCQEALDHLAHKKIDRIILTRPTVSVEAEDIGFLPGDIKEKMSPWTRPIYDHLYEFHTPRDIEKLVAENKLEICPLGFMRGRTFRKSIIILDEAQNTTPVQMKMILTRIGEGSKLFVNGDIRQSDLPGKNGLQDILERIQFTYRDDRFQMIKDGFGMVIFENRHILRHPIIEKVVDMYTADDGA